MTCIEIHFRFHIYRQKHWFSSYKTITFLEYAYDSSFNNLETESIKLECPEVNYFITDPKFNSYMHAQLYVDMQVVQWLAALNEKSASQV